MSTQKYGLGKQDFASLRERGFVYVDKTQYIIKLLEGSDCYFLSRPRRFGKSLFLSTLEYFFLGRRDLFQGLAIENYDWDWAAFPIVRINLGEGSFSSPGGLTNRLIEIVEDLEDKYKIQPRGSDPRGRLRNIILKLREKEGKGVIILVDEYEKPLLDAIDKPYFEEYRGILHDFYSVFKNNEESIRFLFITGVTRFGHLNIFSGLNNLRDLSFSEEFSGICGITEAELTETLRPGIERFAEKQELTYDDAVKSLKKYYDGYHFSESMIDIYNPFSLLGCLTESKISTNWFESGSASFLVGLLQEKDYDLTDIEGVEVLASRLKTIPPALDDPIPLLYQSGYLTIKKYSKESGLYRLGYPNYEVKNGMLEILVPYYLGKPSNSVDFPLVRIKAWIEGGEIKQFMEWLSGLFADLSYDVNAKDEREFRNAIYFIFNFIGFREGLTVEKRIATGRIDMVLESRERVYIFEFKVGYSPEEAIRQIRERGYAEPYRGKGKKVYAIGVSFNPYRRIIEDYRIEEMQD